MSDPVGKLRVATYNVHGCIGTDGQRSESRTADVIARLSADIVGLQELDLNRRRSAGIDQAGRIADQLGWERVFHPAMRREDEAFGDAIITRFPFVVRQAQELPARAPWWCRETRSAIWIEVKTSLGSVHAMNTHLGLGIHERALQATLLAGDQWLGRVPRDEPLVLLGDFNSTARSRTCRILARHLQHVTSGAGFPSRFATFPTVLPLLAVDHIFVNDRLHAEHVFVAKDPLARVASDHYPLVAELRTPNARVTTPAARITPG